MRSPELRSGRYFQFSCSYISVHKFPLVIVRFALSFYYFINSFRLSDFLEFRHILSYYVFCFLIILVIAPYVDSFCFVFICFSRLTFHPFCFRIYQRLSVAMLRSFDCASEWFEYILSSEEYDEFSFFPRSVFRGISTVGCSGFSWPPFVFYLSPLPKADGHMVDRPVLAYFFYNVIFLLKSAFFKFCSFNFTDFSFIFCCCCHFIFYFLYLTFCFQTGNIYADIV